MSRYFYYNVMVVSLLNLMLFVPHILLRFRYDGAVSSMAVAVVIGSTLALMFTKVMKAFPGKGLPEILQQFFPKIITIPFLLFVALMWLVASSIALIGYAVLINRFLNPDTSPLIVLGFLVLIITYSSSRSSLTVIFIIEMGLLINTPLLLFILLKAARSTAVDWDAIRTIANYWNKPPKLQPVSAASYIFTGYINYAIFNRLNPPNFRLRYRWVIPVFGTFILLLSFFVPIGFHGTESVDNYLYIWSVTADSMLMEYGFIERVIFLFLILYLNLTLLYTTIGWHQAMELVKSCLPHSNPQIDTRKTPKVNWIITSIFALFTLVYAYLFNEKDHLNITTYWLTIRMFTEAASVLFLFVLVLRRKSST